jgi:hypothetical protein
MLKKYLALAFALCAAVAFAQNPPEVGAATEIKIHTGTGVELSRIEQSRLGGGARPIIGEGVQALPVYSAIPDSKPVKPIQKQDVYGRILGEDFFFYRNTLSERERMIYDRIYANLAAGKTSTDMPAAITAEQLGKIIEAVIYDNPDIFWVSTSYVYSYFENTVLSVTIQSDMLDNLEASKESFFKCANSVLERAMKLETDIDKVKFIHDLLVNITTYKSNQFDQTAYGPIVTGESVCSGYSRAFLFYMQRLGIPCAVLIGTAGGGHAWNLLKLDGDYYAMDVTWDDPIGASPGEYYYEYFNIPDEQFGGERLRNDISTVLPAAEGLRYSYKVYYKNRPGSDFTALNYGSPTAILPDIYYSGAD